MSKATEAADTTTAASSSSGPYEHGGLDRASSSSTSLTLSSIHHRRDNAPKIEESDEEDMFTVPDVGDEDDEENGTEDSPKNSDLQLASGAVKRRRGRNPVDRECRRLKRLLRNRVSAQQARERKKVYVHDMEAKAQMLVEANARLEEKISTLVNENAMLRKILMNTRPKAAKTDDSAEPTKNLLR